MLVFFYCWSGLVPHPVATPQFQMNGGLDNKVDGEYSEGLVKGGQVSGCKFKNPY